MADSDARRRELAKIHILAGELGLDTSDRNPECEYRSMLWTIARVRSAGALDQRGRLAVLEHLVARKRRAGLAAAAEAEERAAPAAGPSPAERPAVQRELQAMVGKIEHQLAALGAGWNYAHGIAERMFKVKRLEWLRPDQMHKVVTALEYQVKRKARS